MSADICNYCYIGQNYKTAKTIEIWLSVVYEKYLKSVELLLVQLRVWLRLPSSQHILPDEIQTKIYPGMAKNCVHLELYSVSPMNSLSVYKFDFISLTQYYPIQDLPPQYAGEGNSCKQSFQIHRHVFDVSPLQASTIKSPLISDPYSFLLTGKRTHFPPLL